MILIFQADGSAISMRIEAVIVKYLGKTVFINDRIRL